MQIRSARDVKALPRDALFEFVAENIRYLTEEEALAVLDNPYANSRLLGTVAQNQRLTGFYSVRLRLAAHRQTPQAHAVKLVHYLHWPDLVRLSVEVTVPAATRRAIDTILLNRVDKLSLGERIASARRCSQALIKVFLFDSDPRVFASLLINQRLREDDLLHLLGSTEATPDQLRMIGDDRRWSYRYAIRKGLVLNARTPRSTAAAQLRYLSRRDLVMLHNNPSVSVYLKRCIERMGGEERGVSRRASSVD